MYRLIALDVDGTLLNPQWRVTPETKAAITKAREQGVRVVLATGRSWQEAEHLVPLSGCDSLMVCQGGATVADCAQQRNLRRWTLPREQALAAMSALEAHGFGMMVFVGDGLVVDRRGDEMFQAYEAPGFHKYKEVVEHLPAFLAGNDLPVNKIYAQTDDLDQFSQVAPHLEGLDGLCLTSSGWNNIEILPKGVDKGTALQALAEMLDIPMEETAGIGDSDNDLGLFSAISMSIAMGNAPDYVKKQAKRVTGSNAENGAAAAILSLLEENKNHSV